MTDMSLSLLRVARSAGLSRLPVPPVMAAIAVVCLWLWGMSSIDSNAMGDTGVLSVITVPYVVSVVLLGVMIALELVRDDLRPRVLAAFAVLFVFVLFSLPNGAEANASVPTGYLHVGFANYIAEHGAVPSGYDARFAWPGFFAGVANVANLAGFDDAQPLLKWAPVFFELLLMAPLFLLARRLLGDLRQTWLAVFVFYIGMWFEQDYLAPQAIALVLYIAVLALAISPAGEVTSTGPWYLRWRSRDAASETATDTASGTAPDSSGRVRTIAVGAVIVLFLLATVPSHQLTPVPMLLGLGVFAFLGATPYRRMWLLGTLIFLAWFAFGARDYWSGHLSTLFGSVGQVGGTLNSGVGERVHGKPDALRMQYLRLGLTAAFLFFALFGAWRLRRRPQVLVLIGLAIGPFTLIGAQNYGGEVVIRTVLYSMPALAILCAAAFGPLLVRPRIGIPVIAATLAVGGLVLISARGTNASFERITTGQLDAAAWVDQNLPRGGTVAVYEEFSPLRLYSTKQFTVERIDQSNSCAGRYVACADRAGIDMLYLSSSQQAYGSIRLGRPGDWLLGDASRELLASGQWTLAYQSGDAEVLVRAH